MSDVSTTTDPGPIPPELDRWNWGAFLLTWIWGIGNRTWIAFLVFVPLVNLVIWVLLGLRGSRWSWEKGGWKNAQEFRTAQKTWAIIGAIVWIALPALGFAIFFGVMSLVKSSGAYEQALAELRASPQAIQAFGEPIEPGFLVAGSIETSGTRGSATLSIPVSGPKASGWAETEAVKSFGTWKIEFLAYSLDGSQDVTVLKDTR